MRRSSDRWLWCQQPMKSVATVESWRQLHPSLLRTTTATSATPVIIARRYGEFKRRDSSLNSHVHLLECSSLTPYIPPPRWRLIDYLSSACSSTPRHLYHRGPRHPHAHHQGPRHPHACRWGSHRMPAPPPRAPPPPSRSSPTAVEVLPTLSLLHAHLKILVTRLVKCIIDLIVAYELIVAYVLMLLRLIVG
jgi:hypothetical protein